MGLAVAFIIDVYLGALVQALVADLIMPIIGLAMARPRKSSGLQVSGWKPTLHCWTLLGSIDNLHNRGPRYLPTRENYQKMGHRIGFE